MSSSCRSCCLTVCVIASALLAVAHAQLPGFEVASVKENRTGSSGVNIAWQPGGRLVATNVTLEILIRIAYGGDVPLPPNRLAFSGEWMGGGDFLRANHYDVVAVAPDYPEPEQMPLMLRTLLADRFDLAAHAETRNVPSYALVAARDDRRPGPNLRRAETPCVAPPPPRPTPPGDMTPTPCIIRNVPGKAVGRSVTMARLAMMLPNWLRDRRPVEERTGFAGEFDLELDWTPLQPLFTALQEQLGLKLEATRTNVEVIMASQRSHEDAEHARSSTPQPFDDWPRRGAA